MVRIDNVVLRAADVSHLKMVRGESYAILAITMRDGTVYNHKDWQGSAYQAERDILAAIEAE